MAQTKDAPSKTPTETAQQKYDREQAERAEKQRATAQKEAERRAALSPQDRAVDDEKRRFAAETEARRLAGLSQEERNAEAEKTEPLPPHQKRLPSGAVIDAREQQLTPLISTAGQTLQGADREVAAKWYAEYLAGQ